MKLFDKLSLIVVAPIKYMVYKYAATNLLFSLLCCAFYVFSIPLLVVFVSAYISVYVLLFSLIPVMSWFILFNHGMNLLIDSAKEIDN